MLGAERTPAPCRVRSRGWKVAVAPRAQLLLLRPASRPCTASAPPAPVPCFAAARLEEARWQEGGKG